MQDKIDKLREIYLANDVDDETRADNLQVISDWQSQIIKLDEFAGWLEHPVTLQIIAQAKKSYVDHSLLLARSRDITDAARQSLWGKQDAMLWLISLADKNVGQELAAIESQIIHALSDV